MNEEISWTTNKGKGKTAINEWDNDHSWHSASFILCIEKK